MDLAGLSQLSLHGPAVQVVDREQGDSSQVLGVQRRVQPESGDVPGEIDPVTGQLPQPLVNPLDADLLVEQGGRRDPPLEGPSAGAEVQWSNLSTRSGGGSKGGGPAGARCRRSGPARPRTCRFPPARPSICAGWCTVLWWSCGERDLVRLAVDQLRQLCPDVGERGIELLPHIDVGIPAAQPVGVIVACSTTNGGGLTAALFRFSNGRCSGQATRTRSSMVLNIATGPPRKPQPRARPGEDLGAGRPHAMCETVGSGRDRRPRRGIARSKVPRNFSVARPGSLTPGPIVPHSGMLC